MTKGRYDSEMKAIRLLQERSANITESHNHIREDIGELKARLAALQPKSELDPSTLAQARDRHLASLSQETPLSAVEVEAIYAEAHAAYPDNVGLADILTIENFRQAQAKIDQRVLAFNERYGLDGWDYAIAGACGLFAAMLDIMFVKAPPKPTTSFTKKVDGTFNRWVQEAFNNVLPPDLSAALSKANTIGSPDSSTPTDLLGAPGKPINPYNHRLKSLAHDPVLGILFGAWDIMNGTCTVVHDGSIVSFPSTTQNPEGSIFQLIGRMLGHLLSDVNAPSKNGNRGMGLPAPFMGLLRMLEGLPFGDSTFGKQIEYMYVNGYDFRQFIVTSIPMTIMEGLLRAFYVTKQVRINNAAFGPTMFETMPTMLNPRFRIILALAYGTTSAVNAGKIYINKNLLDANYASWMGLCWNGFHALRWALLDRNIKLWDNVESKEMEELNSLIVSLDGMSRRAESLSTR